MLFLFDRATTTQRRLLKRHLCNHRISGRDCRVRVNLTPRSVSELIPSYRPSLTTAGLNFTAYSSISVSSTDTGCATTTTEVRLSTPFFVPTALLPRMDRQIYTLRNHLSILISTCLLPNWSTLSVAGKSLQPQRLPQLLCLRPCHLLLYPPARLRGLGPQQQTYHHHSFSPLRLCLQAR